MEALFSIVDQRRVANLGLEGSSMSHVQPQSLRIQGAIVY